MSRDVAASKRYAKALFEVARDHGRVSEVEQDLRLIADTLKNSAELRQVLEHPSVQPEDKKKIVQSLFAGKIGSDVSNLLLLLADRRREAILPTLVEDYVKIANEALGQAEAIVTTPLALTDEEIKVVAEHFGKITGKKIRVTNQIDDNLLGGMQVRIGDRLYDGSLAGKLNRLRKTLVRSQAL
ncbi:F0F1 ATP synthase subunit delta [Gorillibacterium massiliense]|uniref:F0F1 ATP synthase subunit delta n=1 Tax=Gorillibacterium massiliense TaxID=1280390 RepID=UPI0004AEA64E|nr:F0F1 ATP synthase subunit delta [Gorillibacterium massiliense]